MSNIAPQNNSHLQSPSLRRMVIRDIATVLSLAIILKCLHDFGRPYRRGFNCDDDTIKYPYKESTVPSLVCYLIGSGVNVVLILLLEFIALMPEGLRNLENFPRRVYLGNAYCKLMVWLFGGLVSETLTDISKFTAGRLRPHFINVCKPVILKGAEEIPVDIYCQQTNPYLYIEDYRCDGDPSKQRDSRLSFLSGHSAYSAYSAVFAVMYVQSALCSSRYGLLKPTLQVAIISAGFYTGLSRVSDYKHHWQDVLAGLLLGTIVASLVTNYVLPSFYKAYSKFIKPPEPRDYASGGGEELGHFNY